MALGIKITLGAAALSSVFAIAVNDRGQAPPAPERDFEERYPVMILPPSDAWRAQVEASAPVAPPEPIVVAARNDAHQGPLGTTNVRHHAPHAEHRRTSCRRVWFTENRHRYWRCRR